MREPKTSKNEPTKLRLKIRDVAEDQGVTMKELIDASGVTKSVVQRMWHNTGTGIIGGDPLESISLRALEQIAKILGVHPRELICWEEELKPRTLRKRASRN